MVDDFSPEANTLAALKDHRNEVFDPNVSKFGGRIVKLMGDGALVEFPSVVDAVQCALSIQKAITENSDRLITLRIGVNLGERARVRRLLDQALRKGGGR